MPVFLSALLLASKNDTGFRTDLLPLEGEGPVYGQGLRLAWEEQQTQLRNQSLFGFQLCPLSLRVSSSEVLGNVDHSSVRTVASTWQGSNRLNTVFHGWGWATLRGEDTPCCVPSAEPCGSRPWASGPWGREIFLRRKSQRHTHRENELETYFLVEIIVIKKKPLFSVDRGVPWLAVLMEAACFPVQMSSCMTPALWPSAGSTAPAPAQDIRESPFLVSLC